ncbi:MAG: hypothetical protein Q9P44_15400 [Anaerolineae bacterium]|nr:hypothetical protein [Anaerolineae bacterium]
MAQQQRQRFERQLKAGVRAAQQGNADRARELLEALLRQDRNNQLGYNELAWIWMASAVTSQKQRRKCLQEVLAINPGNRAAREAINSLVGVIGSGDSIDYAKIAGSARAKMPVFDDDNKVARPKGGISRGSGGSNMPFIILGIVGVVIVVALLGSFFLASSDPEPTATPIPPTETDKPEDTRTPLPTNISNIPPIGGQVVERPTDRPVPTNTPIDTATPPPTLTPTATLPPLENITLYIVGEDDVSSGILYRAIADGTGLQRLADNIIRADIEPSVNQITFTRLASTGSEGESVPSIVQAYVADFDDIDNAAQASRLPTGTVEAVSLSPDGTRIVYAATQDGDSEIYLLNIQTGIVQKLTDNIFADTDPSWSTDGTQILFTSDRNSLGRNDIFVHNLTNSETTLVVDTNGLAASPHWSPDGSQIAYVDSRNANESSIFVSSADGSRSRQLQFRGSSRLSAPVWSNDGRYVVFISHYDDRADEIVFMTPDGQERRVLFPEIPSIRSVILR